MLRQINHTVYSYNKFKNKNPCIYFGTLLVCPQQGVEEIEKLKLEIRVASIGKAIIEALKKLLIDVFAKIIIKGIIEENIYKFVRGRCVF